MFRLLSSCLLFSFLTTFFSFLTTFAYADEPCAPNFSAFLVKFEASREFQRQNTRFPLTATYLDDTTGDEPQMITYTISGPSEAKYSRVLFPDTRLQATTPLAKSVNSQQENVLVQVTKPDTDYSMTFRFEKTASCWQLVRFDDHSL